MKCTSTQLKQQFSISHVLPSQLLSLYVKCMPTLEKYLMRSVYKSGIIIVPFHNPTRISKLYIDFKPQVFIFTLYTPSSPILSMQTCSSSFIPATKCPKIFQNSHKKQILRSFRFHFFKWTHPSWNHSNLLTRSYGLWGIHLSADWVHITPSHHHPSH